MSTKPTMIPVQATTPALQVAAPRPGAVVLPGRLHVVGIVTGKLFPEPFFIGQVTVSVDSGPAVDAVLTKLAQHPHTPPAWRFTADIPVSGGAHHINVKATYDTGAPAGSVSVPITVAPFAFSATATMKTAASEAPGPYQINFATGASFSANRHTVSLVNFPALATPDVTVTLISGGTGTFDPASGNMNIPVTLKFHPSSSLASDAQITLNLTTGFQTSPHGHFSDHGAPMDASGAIVLVGDGTFNGGFPLGGNDGSLVLVGTFAPHP